MQHRAALWQHSLAAIKLGEWYATALKQLTHVLTLSSIIL
jgi:hypothetical protein